MIRTAVFGFLGPAARQFQVFIRLTMRITCLSLGIGALLVVTACHRQTPKASFTDDYTLVDAAYDLPEDADYLSLQFDEPGGVLKGELSVASGSAVNLEITVNDELITQHRGVKRVSFKQGADELPSGTLGIKVEHPGTEATTINLDFSFLTRGSGKVKKLLSSNLATRDGVHSYR